MHRCWKSCLAGCAGVLAIWCAASPAITAQATQPAPELPGSLAAEQFWALSSELSEPGGYFRSDNLVSNEHTHQYVIPSLQEAVAPGGVYLGVAPDQNFTYIIATRPRMAFILDVRRGNLVQHLLYKALFELSSDRAEFVSRLFSKPRPAGLSSSMSVLALFSAYARVTTSEELYKANLAAVVRHLTKTRGFGLTEDDLAQLEAIYFAFYWEGPAVRYSTGSFGGRRGGGFPTYEEMIIQTDWEGNARSYLATEANFRLIRTMQQRNLIVPVVGDFSGPKALRSIGRWVRARGGVIGAYYVSNVEQYLFQDGLFEPFARNVSTLPVDDRSTFIRSVSSRFGYRGTMTWTDGRASALYSIRQFVRDFELGLLQSYYDVNSRSR